MKNIYTIVVLVLLTVQIGYAQDCAKECSKWKFEFSAGAWNEAATGDVTANSLPGNIDMSLKDKLNSPDFSFFADFEMRNDKLIIIGQLTSINQTGNGTFVNSIYDHSRSTIRPLFFAVGMAFNFYKGDDLDLDLFGGMRYNLTRQEVTTYLKDGTSQFENENRGFIDPLVGLRFTYTPFKSCALKDLYFKGYFDLGGFGLVSYLSFQSYASVGYKLNENFSLRLGYRYMDVHYGLEKFLFDMGFQGLEFAATARF